MARQIFEPSLSSDSPVNFMCNNMGFLKNLLSSDFGGHFFIFGLYFMILSSEKNDILPMVEPLNFAVSAQFRLKTLFYNLIRKYLFQSRPLQDGMTSEPVPVKKSYLSFWLKHIREQPLAWGSTT